MNKKSMMSILFSIGVLFSGSLYAEVDINAGKARARMCLSCHGQDGYSSADNIPNLAGQKPAYLVNQLRAFRDKKRKGGMMNNMAKGLSNQEINNIAAFFASLEPKSVKNKGALIKKGKDKLAMCMGCHGVTLEGRGMAPRLAGQHKKYIVKQLQDFKSKQRIYGMMNHIASGLSEQDMRELAEYLGRL